MNVLLNILHKPLHAALAGALACALPAAALVASSPVEAQTRNASRQLDSVISALRDIRTLKADFTQTDRAGQSIGGKLTLKSPGKLRMSYNDANMLVVSNGKAVSFIDYDVQQVERWPFSDSPLGALLNPKRDVKQFGTLMPTPNPDVISVEVRDPKKPEYGRITLIMVKNAAAPGGLELVSWVALDAQNHRTTVRLANHRYGMSVSDSTFNFRDPRRTTRRPG